jgi:hypothetical protein
MQEPISFRTIVQFTIVGVLVMCAIGYVVFQARFLITGPQISLAEEPPQISNERHVVLAGSAHNISRVWLNDRQIFTNAQGEFAEQIILENGPTIATLRAEDRYGRETTITRTIVYLPASHLYEM